MKKCCSSVFILLNLCVAVRPQTAMHVVLVSIDGMRPAFYLDKRWPAPNLQRLATEGAYAEGMRSVFPSYTYPSHVAMLTGALPARSGIYYNARIGSKGDWNWFTAAIKVPTLWQVLKKAGLPTAAVEWPVSVDSSITYNVPEIWPSAHPEDRISETRKYATPGLVAELERNATGKLDSSNMNEAFFSMDANSGRIAAYIFTRYKPFFLAVHFASVDGMEHDYGLEGDSVSLAVAAVDRAIGDLLEAVQRSGIKDNTVILIAGDHGFSNIHTAIRANVWLAQNGLLDRARFQPAGGSAFLYLQSKNDDATLRRVRAVLDTVGQRSLFRVITRQELNGMGADSNAVLALAAKPGTMFSGADKGDVTFTVKGGHHGYDPGIPEMMTGFIAAGNGIRKGRIGSPICVTDIAPLVMRLLGIQFSCPDGHLPEAVLR